MTDDVTWWVDEMFSVYGQLREMHNLTHVGSIPAVDGHESVLWGLRYPDCTLLVFNRADAMPYPTDRTEWESLTSRPPPWPWLEDGERMVIPNRHTQSTN